MGWQDGAVVQMAASQQWDLVPALCHVFAPQGDTLGKVRSPGLVVGVHGRPCPPASASRAGQGQDQGCWTEHCCLLLDTQAV